MIFKYHTKYIFILIAILLISSCSDIYRFNIETIHPPLLELPTNLKSVGIINSVKANKDTNSVYFYTDESEKDSIDEKKLTAEFIVNNLHECLEGSCLYSNVTVNELVLPHNLSDSTQNQQIKFLSNFCKLKGLDALTIVKNIDYQIYEDIEDVYIFDEFFTHKAKWGLKYDIEMQFFNSKTNTYLDSKHLVDTIYNSKYSILFENAEKFMPDFVEYLELIAENSASDYCKRISSWWKPQKRYIYVRKRKWDNSIDDVKKGEWEKAKEKWLPIAERKSNKLGAMSAFNMAVASEMDGNIEEAIYWASISYKKFYIPKTLDYIKKLKERQKEIPVCE